MSKGTGHNHKKKMKKIIVILFLLVAFNVYAGQKRLANGVVAMWQDTTQPILYNSYRVTVSLSERCNYDIYGTVYLGNQSKSFSIPAGSKSGFADFENLDNGRRYSISVSIN